MPPGTSSVTPTRPAVSSARARVKPTTPNLLAQYAVASETALKPRVEVTVTTVPPARSSAGRAARTTAAVPSRLTARMRSQVAPGTSSSRPGVSVAAAVTTPVGSPWASIARATAASAALGSARSTSSWACPSRGGLRSRTMGAPPASATACAVAAPSPEAPPVIRVTPTPSAGIQDLLEQPRGRAPGQERQDHGLPAPAREQARLGQVLDGVVPSLGPQVGADPVQRGLGRVFLEGHHSVDAVQRAQDRHAILLGLDGPVGTLEPRDRRVGVEQDDQAVPQIARGAQRPHVTGVQQVEASAGGDHGAAAAAHAGQQVADGVGRPFGARPASTAPAPPDATKAEATRTARPTASESAAPPARARAAAEAKRSPAPH